MASVRSALSKQRNGGLVVTIVGDPMRIPPVVCFWLSSCAGVNHKINGTQVDIRPSRARLLHHNVRTH
jgi:hypothetical protein